MKLDKDLHACMTGVELAYLGFCPKLELSIAD